MSDENENPEELVQEESLIDDVFIEEQTESPIEEQIPVDDEVEEIVVPLDIEEEIPIGEEPVVPMEAEVEEFDDNEEDVTASGMNQEATMRIHQLMRNTLSKPMLWKLMVDGSLTFFIHFPL